MTIKQSSSDVKLVRNYITDPPIYYYHENNYFIYDTNIKNLICQMSEVHPDPVGVYNFLTFGYLPFELTPIKNIYKLEPGETLTWNAQAGIKKEINRTLPQFEFAPDANDESYYVAQIQNLLRASIKKTLQEKNPEEAVIMLSGGIDSSMLTALVREMYPKERLRTFTVGFEEVLGDDIHYARKVARHLKTDHREKILSGDEAIAGLLSAIREIDLPTSNQRVFIRKYYQDENTGMVHITGMGGDELFLGWPQFHQLLQPDDVNKEVFLPRFLMRQNATKRLLPYLMTFPFTENQKHLLFTKQALEDVLMYMDKQPLRGYTLFQTPEEGVKLLQEFCLRYRIPHWQLIWIGYGNIYPYLAEDFMKFALTIPVRYKIKDGIEKYILRQSARPYLPQEVVTREDIHRGGTRPGERFAIGLKEIERSFLSASYLVDKGILNGASIKKIVDSIDIDTDNRNDFLRYCLAVLEIWFRGHV